MEQVNVFIIISTYLFLLRAKLMQTATGAAVSICSSNNATRSGAHHRHESVKRGAMDHSAAMHTFGLYDSLSSTLPVSPLFIAYRV